MSNEMTKFFGSRSKPDGQKANAAMKDFAKTKFGSSRALLRFQKDGNWVFGADNEELEEGTELYADPFSLSAGYVAWHKGTIENELMQPISDGPVDPDRLTAVQAKKGWENQASIDLVLPWDDPIQMIYKVSSFGGLRELSALAGVFAVAMAENQARHYAVLSLGSDSYEHKEYGKVYTPEFTVVEWLDQNGEKITNRKRLA